MLLRLLPFLLSVALLSTDKNIDSLPSKGLSVVSTKSFILLSNLAE